MECPACSAVVPDGSRFCPACGQALRNRSEERRVLTVLFADIVGFTGISERVDPEHLRNLIDRAFQRLVTDITNHGGRVDKIVGDQIMALFGAPVAHEDDAERAVRAGLQMLHTLSAFSDEIGLPVHMRVGVNTGEALVGTLRAGGEYTAMGDAVNVASRLQSAANPGRVVVGPVTYEQTREVVKYEPLGSVQVRGREEPVEMYVATETLAPPGRRPRRHRSPLKGRERELQILCTALEIALRRRRPHVFVLVGEAGIGKSRLADELTRAARDDHDALVLHGQCVPYGEANLWWPIAEAVRQALGIGPTDTAEEATAKTREKVAWGTGKPSDHPDTIRAVDGLLYLLGLPSGLHDVDPARARDDATRAFIGLLHVLAHKHPLVLVLSELHWADQLVLDLADRLPDKMRGLPFVLVGTGRTDLEERWTPQPVGRSQLVMQLDPLERRDAAQLVEALLDGAATRALVDAVLDRAGGNPFFIEELTALLHQAPSGAGELPVTLRSLVATRLDALPAPERRVLDHASVIGRLGSVEALDALDDSGPGDARRMLTSLASRDLVTLEGSEWSFRSDLVREVAYGTLTKAERARHHAALGNYLACQAKERHREREQLDAIAHHLALAAEIVRDLGAVDGVTPAIIDDAIDSIAKAADQAERREVPAVVARLADRALELLPADRREARRRFLVRRAGARTLLHQTDAARADIAQVVAEAEAEGDAWSMAAALTVRGHIEQTEGALYESVANLDEAIARWRKLGDRAGEAEALRRRGMTDMFLGRLASAEETISQALALYCELDDRRGQAWAQWTTAWIAFTGGDFEKAEEQIAEALKLFEEIGDYGGLAWAHGLLAWTRLQQGYLDDAERLADQSLHEVDREADRWALGMLLMLRASTRLWRGNTEEAVRLAGEAREMFASINDPTGELRAVVTLARAQVHAGRIVAAEDLLRTARRMAERELDPEARSLGSVIAIGAAVQVGDLARGAELVSRFSPGTALPANDHAVYTGLAYLQLGRPDDAIATLREAYQVAAGPGLRTNAGTALAFALAAAGRHADALAQADAVAAEHEGTYLDRITLRYARGFALLRQDATAAVAEFDAAVAAADGTGDRLTQALARLARARALEARWHPRSGPALQDAHARLTAIGLEHTAWDDVFRRAARSG